MQWNQFVLAQVGDVISNQVSEQDFAIVIGDIEGAVILRQALIEPGRHIFAERVVDQQMCVLVKNYGKRIVLRIALSSQGNVVDVLAGLKVAGNVWIVLE